MMLLLLPLMQMLGVSATCIQSTSWDMTNPSEATAAAAGLLMPLLLLFVMSGTCMLSTGWDMTNPSEATAAAVMAEVGYTTASFGKWAHSSMVEGYEPWSAGFNESYVRSKYEPDMLLR
jgi:hypothetical protein